MAGAWLSSGEAETKVLGGCELFNIFLLKLHDVPEKKFIPNKLPVFILIFRLSLLATVLPFQTFYWSRRGIWITVDFFFFFFRPSLPGSLCVLLSHGSRRGSECHQQ